MPAATSIIMGVTAAASVYGVSESVKAAGKAEKLQAEALGMSREQYARYKELFGPLEERLVEESQLPAEEQPGVQAALSDIDKTASTRSATLRRMMAGRAPGGSGLDTAVQLSTDISRGEQRGKTLADAGEARFQRMLQVTNLGRGIPQATGANITNAANVLSGQAMEGFAGAGRTLGDLSQLYTLNQGGGDDIVPPTIDLRTQGRAGR